MDPSEADPATARRRIAFAILALAADMGIYWLVITPLVHWAEMPHHPPSTPLEALEKCRHHALPALMVQYGLRAIAATLIAGAMLRTRAVEGLAGLGLTVRGFRGDARWTLKTIALLTGVSLALMGAAILVLRAVKPSLAGWPLELRFFGPGWTHVVNSLIAAPLVEEFVCRSLITPGLVAGYGRRWAIGAGAVIFYCIHLGYGQPWWMAHYLVGGAILTWAYVARGKLWICVLLHAGGNVLVILDDLLLEHFPGVFKAIVGGLPPL